MKTLMSLILLFVSCGASAQESSLLGARYEKCVEWTTLDDMKTSKGFLLTYELGEVVQFSVMYFEHTANCQGEPKQVMDYEIEVLDSSGGHSFKVMTGRDFESKTYYQMMLSQDSASIRFSETLPIKPKLGHSIFLKRVN